MVTGGGFVWVSCNRFATIATIASNARSSCMAIAQKSIYPAGQSIPIIQSMANALNPNHTTTPHHHGHDGAKFKRPSVNYDRPPSSSRMVEGKGTDDFCGGGGIRILAVYPMLA